MTLKQAYATFVITPLLLGTAGGMVLLAMLCLATGALFSMIVIANAWLFLIEHTKDALTLFLALSVATMLGLTLLNKVNGQNKIHDDKRPFEG